MLGWLKRIFGGSPVQQPASSDNLGWWAVAKRDLDYGGESLSIPFKLPCSRDEVTEYCERMDKLELLGNPNSGVRYFPTTLTDDEIKAYKAGTL
jgi:hypothetical protein